MRERYFVLASLLYLVLGGVIVVRSLVAHVAQVAILGVVLIALGAVRLRDYRRRNAS